MSETEILQSARDAIQRQDSPARNKGKGPEKSKQKKDDKTKDDSEEKE